MLSVLIIEVVNNIVSKEVIRGDNIRSSRRKQSSGQSPTKSKRFLLSISLNNESRSTGVKE